MANVSDWKMKVARAIVAVDHGCFCVTIDEAQIVEILHEHAPFKDDALYMEVPRCDGCKHGVPPDPTLKHQRGEELWCKVLNVGVTPSFGCTMVNMELR